MDDRDDANEPRIPLEFLTRSYSKKEIKVLVHDIIEACLQYTDSGVLYIFFKELEYGVKLGIEILREQAFDSLGYHLGGVTSGRVFGHEVVISWPKEWRYSEAVEEMKERQKEELAGLQEQEKLSGIARPVTGNGKITITIRRA